MAPDPQTSRHGKLSLQMLALLLGALALVLLVISLVTYLYARSLIVKELKAKSTSKVSLAARQIDTWLQTKKELFDAIRSRIAYQDKGPTFNAAFFKRMLALNRARGVESIYMGYARGDYCTGTGWIPPKGWDFTRRPWYVEASRAGRIVYTAPYMDARTKLPMITIAGPLYKDGALLSVMSVDVLIEDINRTVNALKIGKRSRAYVTDHEGRFISHPDPARALKDNIRRTSDYGLFSDYLRSQGGQAGEVKIYEGTDYVVVARVPETGWILFFHLPASEVNRPLGNLFRILWGGILAALALLGITVFMLSRRVTRPILLLAAQSKHVARGDYDVHLEVSSHDEIGYVTQCFNDMAAGLKEREFIKSTFGRYVSKDVMQEILQGNIELGGEKRELSILFSDIRGFTNLSEGLDPIELVTLLNGYFKRMDQAISEAGGSINKYLGDGILAIFGAPNRLENSALAAVQSAHGKIAHLDEFNRRQGTSLQIGIGIHTGVAVVGNIGSENRTEYAVIGESVNMSDRVESLTKNYGVPLLITEPTAQKLPDMYLLRSIDLMECRHGDAGLRLFTPYLRSALTAERQAYLMAVNEVMEVYLRGQWKAFLDQATARFPEPDTALRYVLGRARERLEGRDPTASGPAC